MAGKVQVVQDVQPFVNELQNEARKRAVRVGEIIRGAAKIGIERGKKSGKFYKVPGTGKVYQASAPGEYPANRTGRLASSLRVSAAEVDSEFIRVFVGTPVSYALRLEGSATRPGLRPFLSKAQVEQQAQIAAILQQGWQI